MAIIGIVTEQALLMYTKHLLTLSGLGEWTAVVNDTVVSDYSGISLGGACVWTQKEIRFNREFLPSDNPIGWMRLAAHEVSHALTPEDLEHGPIFQAKWDELLELTREDYHAQ